MKAKKKLVERLRKINTSVEQQVIKRYLRFCRDQMCIHWLYWRKRVEDLNLTKKEMLGFKWRISLLKTANIHERKRKFDALQPEEREQSKEDFGEPIERLIPCLDPDIADSKKLD